jgi:hypothetical protein
MSYNARKERKLYKRDYYLRHPEVYQKGKKHAQEALKAKRAEILALLGNRCVRCGFSDPRALQIDHIHGKGREERYNGGWTYYTNLLAKIKAGSKDYQILCSNCNWIKRSELKEDGRTEWAKKNGVYPRERPI